MYDSHDYELYQLSRKIGLLVDLETARPEKQWLEEYIEAEAWQVRNYTGNEATLDS